MKSEARPLSPGLYFVATPIGNARDITLRALDVLAGADVLAAEDTRTMRHLMEIHGLSMGDRRAVAYHDHNGERARPGLLAALADGKSVAYVSEAGTPTVADPGFGLAQAAIAAGHVVTGVPGASAVVNALTIGGLPTDRFLFAGFLPPASGARKKILTELRETPATLVFYESPKRIHKALADMCEVLGEDRQAAVCRELTKKFEEVLRGSLADLHQETGTRTLKGEIVVLVDRNRSSASEDDLETSLETALATMSVRDASDFVATQLNLPRRRVYQAALSLGKAK